MRLSHLIKVYVMLFLSPVKRKKKKFFAIFIGLKEHISFTFLELETIRFRQVLKVISVGFCS